ncbi:hypothetical protein K501DRAFT_206870 [Backusella circina FSU 941]|nr:hypothetical protein K501DRAFT_206870 [Backusella circina FSU 941]
MIPNMNYIESVRQSCKTLYEKCPVKISESGIQQFLQGLDKLQYDELSIDTPMKMPLKFDSVEEEVNFIATIDLLNFGSGYRRPLHEMIDRGAFDTIRFGVMSFHIGGTPMDAECYKNMSLFQVSEIFQIPLTRDVPHEKLDFVTVAEPTELRPFAIGITSVLNSTGEFLVSKGYKNLAEFLMDKNYDGQRPTAHELVKRLVDALPGMRDDAQVYGDQTVYLFKKAQIMVYHLYLFFKDQLPECFDFEDINNMTIFSDNVIPTILAHFKVLTLPEEWRRDIEENKDMGEERATVLRAAAIVACDDIVKAARGGEGPVNNMTTGSLDVYLWRVAKEGELRKVPRFEYRDTVMF